MKSPVPSRSSSVEPPSAFPKWAPVDQFIERVPKVGYRFVVPVSCLLYTGSPPRHGAVDDAPTSGPAKEQLLPETVSSSAHAAPSSSRASTRKGRDFASSCCCSCSQLSSASTCSLFGSSGQGKKSCGEQHEYQTTYEHVRFLSSTRILA